MNLGVYTNKIKQIRIVLKNGIAFNKSAKIIRVSLISR